VWPLRGENPQNRPLSKLNNRHFALRAMLPVNNARQHFMGESLRTEIRIKVAWLEKRRSGKCMNSTTGVEMWKKVPESCRCFFACQLLTVK